MMLETIAPFQAGLSLEYSAALLDPGNQSFLYHEKAVPETQLFTRMYLENKYPWNLASLYLNFTPSLPDIGHGHDLYNDHEERIKVAVIGGTTVMKDPEFERLIRASSSSNECKVVEPLWMHTDHLDASVDLLAFSPKNTSAAALEVAVSQAVQCDARVVQRGVWHNRAILSASRMDDVLFTHTFSETAPWPRHTNLLVVGAMHFEVRYTLSLSLFLGGTDTFEVAPLSSPPYTVAGDTRLFKRFTYVTDEPEEASHMAAECVMRRRIVIVRTSSAVLRDRTVQLAQEKEASLVLLLVPTPPRWFGTSKTPIFYLYESMSKPVWRAVLRDHKHSALHAVQAAWTLHHHTYAFPETLGNTRPTNFPDALVVGGPFPAAGPHVVRVRDTALVAETRFAYMLASLLQHRKEIPAHDVRTRVHNAAVPFRYDPAKLPPRMGYLNWVAESVEYAGLAAPVAVQGAGVVYLDRMLANQVVAEPSILDLHQVTQQHVIGCITLKNEGKHRVRYTVDHLPAVALEKQHPTRTMYKKRRKLVRVGLQNETDVSTDLILAPQASLNLTFLFHLPNSKTVSTFYSGYLAFNPYNFDLPPQDQVKYLPIHVPYMLEYRNATEQL